MNSETQSNLLSFSINDHEECGTNNSIVYTKTTISQKQSSQSQQRKGMTTFEAGLAMLSAIVGGGIVGVPFSMILTGIPCGIILNLAIALANSYTANLFFRCIDLSPTYVESLYELGFVVMGTASIYIISMLNVVSNLGCMMIYFIVFGDISASLAKQMYDLDTENILTSRFIHVIWVGLVMLPICL